MSTCYITEYTMLGYVGVNPTQLIQAPGGYPVAEQHITISTTTQSAALNVATKFVRIVSDAVCSLAFGTNPTAVATAHLLPANTIVYYAVPAGSKIAVVSNP